MGCREQKESKPGSKHTEGAWAVLIEP